MKKICSRFRDFGFQQFRTLGLSNFPNSFGFSLVFREMYICIEKIFPNTTTITNVEAYTAHSKSVQKVKRSVSSKKWRKEKFQGLMQGEEDQYFPSLIRQDHHFSPLLQLLSPTPTPTSTNITTILQSHPVTLFQYQQIVLWITS